MFAITIAIIVRWLFDSALGVDQLPYGAMLVAAVVTAWLGGTRPALVVVLAGGIAANFFLQPPRWTFAFSPEADIWRLIVFFVLGGTLSLFGGHLHRERARAVATSETLRHAELALREAHDGLEQRVNERTRELAYSNDSLRASEERFRLLIESLRGCAIVMLDEAGAIVAWNAGAERLFAHSQEIVGRSIATVIRDFDRAALADSVQQGARERTAVRGDGGEFCVELEVHPLAAPARVAGELFAVIVRDISERKRLLALTEQRQQRADELRRKSEELAADNRRMQEAARLQSEFLANMSHELRTPLNAIIGFADLMYGGMAGALDVQQREFLGDILTSSRHLLQLITDVLDLAQIESGTLEVVPEPLELARAIGEVRDILRTAALERRIELELQLAAELGSATVDPAKLRQILYNYVSNAVKFTPEGGRVVIRAARTAHAIPRFRIEVEDTGIGIAAEDLRYLFVPFRQLDASATKRYQGTGLGLALTKRFAEAHGGAVGVNSVRGTGSVFWVELPYTAVPPRRTSQRLTAPIEAPIEAPIDVPVDAAARKV